MPPPSASLRTGAPRPWRRGWAYPLQINLHPWEMLTLQRQLPPGDAFVNDGESIFWMRNDTSKRSLGFLSAPSDPKSCCDDGANILTDESARLIPESGSESESEPDHSSVPDPEFQVPFRHHKQGNSWSFDAGGALPPIRGEVVNAPRKQVNHDSGVTEHLRLLLPLQLSFTLSDDDCGGKTSPQQRATALLLLRISSHYPDLRCILERDALAVESHLELPRRAPHSAPRLDNKFLRQLLEGMWLVAHQLLELLDVFQDETIAREYCEQQPPSLRKDIA